MPPRDASPAPRPGTQTPGSEKAQATWRELMGAGQPIGPAEVLEDAGIRHRT